MRNSAWLLMVAVMTLGAHIFRPTETIFIAGIIALCAFYLCRAIENNGSDL